MNISPEEFADAVVDSLRLRLPAALAAQTERYAASDAAAGRVVELDAPDAAAYFPGGTQVVNTYPTIEVAAPDMQVANLTLGAEDGDVTFNLLVRCYDRHPVFDVLYRKMSRLGAAIASVLVTPGAVADCTVDAFRGAWRFNPETETRDEIVSGVLLAFTISTTMIRA